MPMNRLKGARAAPRGPAAGKLRFSPKPRNSVLPTRPRPTSDSNASRPQKVAEEEARRSTEQGEAEPRMTYRDRQKLQVALTSLRGRWNDPAGTPNSGTYSG